jgi:tRNA modification GTPase
VAILGQPNSGKSSLLNAMLNFERAIVTDIPGTTRDVIEERLDVGGFPLVLTDTAGIRETADPVESLGVQRSRLSAAEADAVWYLYDASAGWAPEDQATIDSIENPVLVVASKSDLPHSPPTRGIEVSAKTRSGIASLTDWVVSNFSSTREAAFLNERHTEVLGRCAEAVHEASEILLHDRPEDLASAALADALEALASLTGESASPDMLHEIFSRFCIGK